MSGKSESMSRKRPTQIELERENTDLRKQVQQLRRRLKQIIKQLNKQEDIALDYDVELEFIAEPERPLEPEIVEDDFMTFTLPNGRTRRIKKRFEKSE